MFDIWVIITLILVLFVYVLFNQRRKPLWIAIAFALFTLISVSGLAAYVVADSMTGHGIDQSVLYHLTVGMSGAGYLEFIPQIVMGIGAGVLCLLMIVGTLYRPKRQKRPHSYISYLVTGLVVMFAIFANPGLANIARILNTIGESQQASTSGGPIAAPADYVTPEFKIPPKRSLIWLYLESFERTYFDEELFPGLTPNLQKLQEIATDFTDIRQLYGTGWTIAGQVASQCGIPLETPTGFHNSRAGVDAFLPGAICLGDLLSEDGYLLTYMKGADIKFAGSGRFFKQHGYQRVRGLYELESMKQDPDYRSNWGLYDDSLLEWVNAEIGELAGNPASRPYGVMALTLDTHHPKGHVSRSCANVIYGDGANPILNAVHCTDRLIGDFVRRLLEAPTADSPLIVLQSDHLAMQNTATEKLEESDARRNFVMVIDPLEQTERAISRPGSMLDVGATVVDMLGAEIEGLGFGRSLFGNTPTLVEQHEDPSAYLRGHRAFLRDLWQFPDLRQGLMIGVNNSMLRMGKRFLQFPVLLQLTPELDIQDVFQPIHSFRSLSEVLSDFLPNAPFLLVDECVVAGVFDTAVAMAARDAGIEYCAVFSSGTGLASHVIELDGSRFFSSEALSDMFANLARVDTAPADIARRHESISDRLLIGGAPDHILALDPSSSVEEMILRSGGFSAPRGTAIFVQANDKLDMHFERGLTLFGVEESGRSVTPLFNFDTCPPMPELLARYGSLEKAKRKLTLAGQYQQYELFVLMSEDSAYCGEREGLAAVQRLYGLKELENIGFRAPYVAVMSRDKILFEAAGQRNHNLMVVIGSDLPDDWSQLH